MRASSTAIVSWVSMALSVAALGVSLPLHRSASTGVVAGRMVFVYGPPRTAWTSITPHESGLTLFADLGRRTGSDHSIQLDIVDDASQPFVKIQTALPGESNRSLVVPLHKLMEHLESLAADGQAAAPDTRSGTHSGEAVRRPAWPR